MSDFIPKPSAIKIGGLSRKAQKLQALRDKAAAQDGAGNAKPRAATPNSALKTSSLAGHKKTAFNRKAV